MKRIISFNDLRVEIKDKEWDYLCQYRFFNDNPGYDVVESEFISGTGITCRKKELWPFASQRFSAYINDLMEI